MLTRALRFLAVFGLLAAAALAAARAAEPSSVRLQVDARQQSGPVPYTFRTGVFLNSLPTGYPKRMFFADQRPGMVELSLDFYKELDVGSETEFFARLPNSNLTAWIREVAAAGGKPYFRLMPVPRWMWSGRNGGRKPPADYQAWERFVERIVDYYNNKLGIDVAYIVWDEPDNFWEGSMDDYLRLYKHSAAGLLKANRNARIGGPASAFFFARIGKNSPPLLPEFIRYCASTPLPGIAQRLPLDILVWHVFDAAPISPGRYDAEVKVARSLLRKHGYGDDVELNIGSWSALEKYPELNTSVRDSEFLGAFVVASVIAMEHAGVERHAFFNLYEDWIREKDEFSNNLGLTTRSYVAKAGYHAYGLLGRLAGAHVAVQGSDPFVRAAAARDGKVLRVVVANFAPPRGMLINHTRAMLLVGGRKPQELKSMLPDAGVGELLKDRRKIENSNLPDDVRTALLGLHDGARLSARRQREPVSLEIALRGLPDGRYRLRTFHVDGNSANPYANRREVERLLGQGRVEEINQSASQPIARAREASGPVDVRGEGYSWRTTIPPYGVLLLEAERID